MYIFYADLYLLLNMAVDLIVLHATRRILGFSTPFWRLLASAFLGSLYALGSLFVALPLWAAAGMKLFFSVIMVGFAFGRWSLRGLVAAVFTVHVISAVVAGVALAVDSLGYMPGLSHFLLPYANGVKLPLEGISVAALLLIGVGVFAWRLVSARMHTSPCIVPIEISLEGRKARFPGLVDTGCSLGDPITGAPALLAEAGALEGLLPRGVLEGCRLGWDAAGGYDFLRQVAEFEPSWASRLRLLPCSTALGGRGLVPAFFPDSIRIGRDFRGDCHGVVGVIPGPLDSAGAYRALVNPRLLSGANRSSGERTELPRAGLAAGVRRMGLVQGLNSYAWHFCSH